MVCLLRKTFKAPKPASLTNLPGGADPGRFASCLAGLPGDLARLPSAGASLGQAPFSPSLPAPSESVPSTTPRSCCCCGADTAASSTLSSASGSCLRLQECIGHSGTGRKRDRVVLLVFCPAAPWCTENLLRYLPCTGFECQRTELFGKYSQTYFSFLAV